MLSPNKTQLSIVVVATLLVVDFIWFGYLPSQRQLELVLQLKERQMEVVDAAKAKRGKVAALREELEGLEQDMGEMGRHIPKDKSIGTFLTEISHLMTLHGLSKQEIVPGTEVPGEVAIRVPVMVQCEGNLRSIYAFYEDLKNIERLVHVDEILLKNDARLAGRLRMEAQFVIFYQPNPIWEGDKHVSAL